MTRMTVATGTAGEPSWFPPALVKPTAAPTGRYVFRRLLSLTVALLAIAVPAVADVVNLLQNPGFEDGLPEPWSVYHVGVYNVARNPTTAHGGDYYATFATRPTVKGGYCALRSPALKVYPGITYEVGVWAKGTNGDLSIWCSEFSESGQVVGNNFGPDQPAFTGEWQHFKRTFTPDAGVLGSQLFIVLNGEGATVSYDDISFSYDRQKFTPPEAETLTVTPQIRAADAAVKVYLDNSVLDGSAKIVYGEHVIGIEAHATGANPGISGAVTVGDHVVKLDKRWRAAPLPQDDGWRTAGFDDRGWDPVEERGARNEEQGIWKAGDAKRIAMRRVVNWKSQRQTPAQDHQWISLMRDRMYLPQGAAGGFVTIIPDSTKLAADALTLHVEVPAFLTLLDRFEQAGSFYSNYAYKDIQTRTLEKNGSTYVHYDLTYEVPDETRWSALAPLYFQAADQISGDTDYTFTFWREWNGNVTDLPMTLPIIVTGPVNGRQCDYFHLAYSRLVDRHSGGFITFSVAERYAMADTCIDAGVNVVWATLEEAKGIYDYHLYLKKNGVKFVWGHNIGMNIPTSTEQLEGLTTQTLERHPELQGRFYAGAEATFENGLGYPWDPWYDLTKCMMWCQEYVAGDATVFYDTLRPQFEKARERLGDILFTFWDWEYQTMQWSCFCDNCKRAFAKFADVANAAELSDEVIVAQHGQQWIRFRFDQSARHQKRMMEFCREFDTVLTNWHPGGGMETSDFDYRLLGESYDYHFMGWPGHGLPLMGIGRAEDFNGDWKKMNPNIHLAGQTVPNMFRGSVIDERMFKIWAVNMALGTYGGGWVMYLPSMYPLPQSHGMSYFLGEATRLINDFEPYFQQRRYITGKFEQTGLKGRPDELLALASPDGQKALVLLFNESGSAVEVTVKIRDAAAPWKTVRQWEGEAFDSVASVTVTVPEKDVIALVYR